jgi:hypothetical protein
MASNGTEVAKSEGSRDGTGLTPAQRSWLEHIRQCEAEGLTYKAYCQREGLKVGGLYAARKVLRGHDDAQASWAASGSPPRFAAVRLSHPDEGGTVEVLLPNGVQMRVTVHCVDAVVRLIQGVSHLTK